MTSPHTRNSIKIRSNGLLDRTIIEPNYIDIDYNLALDGTTHSNTKYVKLTSGDIGSNLTWDGSNVNSSTSIRNTITSLKQSLVNMTTLKDYGSVNYQATSTNFEYTGLSFTIPAGKGAFVIVYSTWSNNKPVGISINTSSTNINLSRACIDNGSTLAPSLTTILGAGTYYVWDKRISVPTETNPISVFGYEFNVN